MKVLKELAEIAASSFDQVEVANRQVDVLVEDVGAKGVFVWTVDDEGRFLLPLGHAGIPPQVVEQAFGGPVSVDSETVTSRVFRTGQLAFFHDAETDETMPDKMRQFNRALGFRSGISLPLVVGEETVGCLSMTWGEPKQFDEDELSFLQSAAADAAMGLHNARLSERLRAKDAAIRQAYTDVIEAVTGGRLLLETTSEVQELVGEPIGAERRIAPGGLGEAVGWLREAIASEFPWIDAMQLVDPAGEALTNAVKHAGGGEYQLYRKGDVAQFRVTDHGPGIDFAHLPKATLQAGYSSVGTLGIGFSAMLKNCERVLLATQPGLTTVVLEVRAIEALPPDRQT